MTLVFHIQSWLDIYISTANKGWSTVNLAFDRPYLSYNDHCHRWLFQEIFFYFQKQPYVEMFFKTGYLKFCDIDKTTSVLEPYGLQLYFKLIPKEASYENCKIFTVFFMEHLQWLLLSVC